MAEDNPELQERLQELEHELEVSIYVWLSLPPVAHLERISGVDAVVSTLRMFHSMTTGSA